MDTRGSTFNENHPSYWLTFACNSTARNIRWDFSQPGCPAQTAYIERFNATYRLEVLDPNQFRTLDDARMATTDWLSIYNEQRTHSAIGHLPPLAFKRRWQQRESLEKTGLG